MPPRAGRVVLVCEGEFDTMLARQVVGDLVEAVTLGGAADQITADATFALACSPCILIATDTDRAGEEAAERWREVSRGTRRIKPPKGKDITEAFLAGLDLREWMHGELESVRPPAKVAASSPAIVPSEADNDNAKPGEAALDLEEVRGWLHILKEAGTAIGLFAGEPKITWPEGWDLPWRVRTWEEKRELIVQALSHEGGGR